MDTEVLIWAICTIIVGLVGASSGGTGAAAAALGERATNLAKKVRALINSTDTGAKAVGILANFFDGLSPIIQKIGPLGAKLRASINEIKQGVVDTTQRIFRTTKYWRKRLDELASQGHGPQRHEGDVTDKQLFDRVYRGIDPATGKPHPKKNGRITGVGKHSTKFNTPADYVRAYEKALEHPNYKALVNSTIDDIDQVKLKMSDVFGPNFQSRIKGFTRASGKTGQQPTIVRTVFPPDTEIWVRFRKENGVVKLTTMFVEPK